MKAILSLLFLATLSTFADAQDADHIVFNEVMQSNIDYLFVEQEFPDSWVELHNPTSQPINLYKWRIGSKANPNAAYSIKLRDAVIAPQGHLLIYCDKEATGLHTHFRLESTQQGKLYLWDDQGQMVDSLHYDRMPAPNIAYGRVSDDSNLWEYKLHPTPGMSNLPGGSSLLLPDPLLTTTAHSVTLSLPALTDQDTPMPIDTRLLYTLDGSFPHPEDSSTFSIAPTDADYPLCLSTDTTLVLRASLYSPSALSPSPITHSVIHHPRPTSLPIISICTDEAYLFDSTIGNLNGGPQFIGNVFKDWRRPVNIEYFDSISSPDPLFNQLCETSPHGKGSLIYAQKSMNFHAHKRFGTKHFDSSRFWSDKPQIRKVKSFCIRNGGNNCAGSRFEEAFVQMLFGQYLPALQYQSYSPVIAYINGQYRGIFGLRERTNEDWMESNLGLDGDSIQMIDNFDDNDPAFEDVARLVADSTSTYADFEQLIDIDQFLDYFCCEAYGTNMDFPHNNIVLWQWIGQGDNRWNALLKDLDYMSWTVDDLNWHNYILLREPENRFVQRSSAHQLLIRLLMMPEFYNSYIDRMQVYLGDFCKPDLTVARVTAMRAEIEAEVAPTFALLDGDVPYSNFDHAIQQSLIPYCQHRPRVLCQEIAGIYDLGTVLPLQVHQQAADDSASCPITIQGIPLRDSSHFDGFLFSRRPLRLNTGCPDYGWQLTIHYQTGSTTTHDYPQSQLSFLLDAALAPDVASCAFQPIPIANSSIEPITSPQDNGIQEVYDLWGRRTTAGHTSGPAILNHCILIQ